jgi:hypothetical protein
MIIVSDLRDHQLSEFFRPTLSSLGEVFDVVRAAGDGSPSTVV